MIKRYHFVYRITNIKDKMYYYGTHTTSKSKEQLPMDELGITYFSSKADKSFQQDQKLNPQNYKYKVLKVFSTREEAIEMEIMLHKRFDVKLHPKFYNESNQTSTGFDTTGTVGHNKGNKKQLICPHCLKKGQENLMKQWHFDNCICHPLFKNENILKRKQVSINKTGKNNPAFDRKGLKNKKTKKYIVYDNNDNIQYVVYGTEIKKLIKTLEISTSFRYRYKKNPYNPQQMKYKKYKGWYLEMCDVS